MMLGTIRPMALSHLSQAFRSLVISRRCHSALYGCWLHNFLPEVSPGSLARVQVLGRHSGCRAWGALRAGRFGCLLHPLPPEVSPGSLARVQVLGRHSGCRAWGALRARGSPLSYSILSEFGSALMVQGLGIRGTARVFEVEANTVLQWLVEAAEPLRAFSQHFLHDVRVRQVQLDE